MDFLCLLDMDILLYIAIGVIVLMFLAVPKQKTNRKHGKTSYEEEISVPNPETVHPAKFIFWMRSTHFEVVKSAMNKLTSETTYKLDDRLKKIYYWMLQDKYNQADAYALFGLSVTNYEVRGCHIPTRKIYIRKNVDIADNVELVPEPDNEYDSDAIAVKHGNTTIGYIPAEETCDVHPILKDVEACYISSVSIDRYIDVLVDVVYKNV